MTERNKKLAEWAELCWHDWKPSSDIDFNSFQLPNGKHISYDGYLYRCLKCGASSDNEYTDVEEYDFTQTLDACFKWLVPKLVHLELRYDCRKQPNGLDAYSAYVQGEGYTAIGNAETPALALCKAIEKLIDEKQVTRAKLGG